MLCEKCVGDWVLTGRATGICAAVLHWLRPLECGNGNVWGKVTEKVGETVRLRRIGQLDHADSAACFPADLYRCPGTHVPLCTARYCQDSAAYYATGPAWEVLPLQLQSAATSLDARLQQV